MLVGGHGRDRLLRAARPSTLPGFTTNVEFGLYCRSGKALLGHPDGAPKMRYLHLLAERFAVPVFHDLPSLLQSAVERIN